MSEDYLDREIAKRGGSYSDAPTRRTKTSRAPKPETRAASRRRATTSIDRWSKYSQPDGVSDACWNLAKHFILGGEQYHDTSIPVNVENFSRSLSKRINSKRDNPLLERRGSKWVWKRLPKGSSIEDVLIRMVDVFWENGNTGTPENPRVPKGTIHEVIEHDSLADQHIFLNSFEALFEDARNSLALDGLKGAMVAGEVTVVNHGNAQDWIKEGLETRRLAAEKQAEHDRQVDELPTEPLDFAKIDADRLERSKKTAKKIRDLLTAAKEKGRIPNDYTAD